MHCNLQMKFVGRRGTLSSAQALWACTSDKVSPGTGGGSASDGNQTLGLANREFCTATFAGGCVFMAGYEVFEYHVPLLVSILGLTRALDLEAISGGPIRKLNLDFSACVSHEHLPPIPGTSWETEYNTTKYRKSQEENSII